MIFDVYLLVKPQAPRKDDSYEIVCSFEDGYAVWIQRLLLQVNEEAGKTIVFIDWAFFGKEDLKFLSQVVSESRQRMKVKPESWEVLLGHDGNKKAIYSKVTKVKMNSLLDKVDEAIRQANLNNGYVSVNFWGGGG